MRKTYSKQKWETGQIVKVGFLTLLITGKRENDQDASRYGYNVTVWELQGNNSAKYEFVPHEGLTRIN